MEVIPVGYKRTEVGVIPEDWEVRELGKLGSFSKGKGIRRNEATSGQIPCIRYGEIYTHHADVVRGFFSRISTEVAKESKRINNGDVLFAGSGETKEEIGKCIAYVDDVEAYAGSDIVILSPKEVDSLYLGYLLNTQVVVRQKASKAQGDAVVHIGAKALGDIRIPLPPTKSEQTAIATALSDADALIVGLEAVIQKQRAIKEGAMQELLSGKKGWKEVSLGNLGTFFKGSGVNRSQANSGELPCVRYGELYTQHDNYIRQFHSWISMEVAENAQRLKKGDILFAGSGETKAEIGKSVAFLGAEEAYAGGDIVILRPNGVDSAFLGYYLNTPAITRQKASRGQGDAVVHIGALALGEISLPMPALEEQAVIASTLIDMDAEIAALETKLEKVRALKAGMMGELLTGRVRLV